MVCDKLKKIGQIFGRGTPASSRGPYAQVRRTISWKSFVFNFVLENKRVRKIFGSGTNPLSGFKIKRLQRLQSLFDRDHAIPTGTFFQWPAIFSDFSKKLFGIGAWSAFAAKFLWYG
jgi:hypothetical protein